MIFDSTGSLSGMSRHDYLPFGEELYAGTNWRTMALGYTGDSTCQKFTGYEADGETGLNFAHARYQSPAQGRFTSADPAGASMTVANPQSFNRYTYVLNSPTNLTDPSGMVNSHGDSRYPWDEDPFGDIPWTTGEGYATVEGYALTGLPATSENGTLTGTVVDPQEEGATLHYWPGRIWYDANGNEVDKSPYGHIALQLSDGTYISFWPGEHLGSLDVGREVEPSMNRTYLDDYNGEHQTDSKTLQIRGLDEGRIKKWWNNGRGHGKFSSGNNCADIVTEALRQGGLVPWTSNVIWSTPYDVWNGTKTTLKLREQPLKLHVPF